MTPDQQPLADHVVERLEGEVRIHRAGAVAEQQRAVVHLARVARLDDQRAARPFAEAHEVMVDARRGEQARHRRAVAIGAAVGQNQDRVAGIDGVARPAREIVDSAPLEARAVLARVEQHRQRGRPEPGLVDVAQLRQLVVVDDRVLDLDLPARLRPRIEQIALRPDRRGHRGHELFADRVERRVGHLREELLEVVVQQPRPVRQRRQRRVGAHRAERLLAGGGHRREQHAEIFVGVSEQLLAPAHRLVARRRQMRRRRQVLDVDQVREPLAIRLRAPPARA